MAGLGQLEANGRRDLLAVALVRVVIPLWLATGAVLKLVDGSASHLPAALIKWCGALGLDLHFVLELSIAVELIVAGVMVALPTLARPVGTALLAAFVPVLIGDVALGASSCGCFGAVQVHPGITLVMDVSFLLGLWLLGRNVEQLAIRPELPTLAVVAAGLWTVAGFALGFGLAGVGNGNVKVNGSGEAAAATIAAAAPAEGYYLPVYDEWIGRPWSEVPLSSWIIGAPSDLQSGTQLLLFYRKDCEHCHSLMEAFFVGHLAIPTTAVAVPERAGFPSVGLQPFVCSECRLAELPAGVDWFLQTPVLVRLEDGIVACAAEVGPDDPRCLAG